MGFFNRYEINDNSLQYSYKAYNDNYCNPKDYLVTTDECDNYLDELIIANQQNKEYNKKRSAFWKRIIYIILVIVDISILALITFWLYRNQSTWLVAVCWLLLVGTIGLSFFIFDAIESYFSNSEIRWDALYPKVNQNIEKLFDDYLWKCELIRYADRKGGTEKQSIYERVEKMSHPEVDLFIETIENELKNPSDSFVFGDVAFGMSLEDIYNTKVFYGLSYDDSREVHLGYRVKYFRRIFNIFGYGLSFMFENNQLAKVIVCSQNYKNEEIIEPFMSCCEKLNEYYGNPTNLQKRYPEGGYELLPNDKAEFRVGSKRILLNIERSKPSYSEHKLMLEFSKSNNNMENNQKQQQDFDQEWFDRVRRQYGYSDMFSINRNIHNPLQVKHNSQSTTPSDIENLINAYEEPFDADLLGDIF